MLLGHLWLPKSHTDVSLLSLTVLYVAHVYMLENLLALSERRSLEEILGGILSLISSPKHW